MCGISGFLTKKYNSEHLQKMTDALSHRGPDAEGIYFDENTGVGLGHRRLSILDLSANANQPYHSICGRYVMVFNGEVYNFKSIAKELNKENGFEPKTTSDTEIVIEAYAYWGDSFVEKFNGMFAIAIWDTQDKQLTLFRDRIGIKPLFYYWKDGVFSFASETKALLSLPIKKSINKEALKDYLFLEYIPSDLSIINDINKLEQGCKLTLSLEGELHIEKWYDLLKKIKKEKEELSIEEYQLEFDKLLTSSVELRSISDVPIGAFLSGGTDSSIICAKFQEISNRPINTFTIGFDVESFDESEYAEKVAKELGSNHTLSRVTSKTSLSIIEDIVSSYDEPFAAPSTIPSLLVCNKASSLSTVALSGDGGDELFMGYGYYNWFKRAQKISKLGKLSREGIEKLSKIGSNRIQRIGRVLNYPSSERFWIHVWSQQQDMFTENEISTLLSEDYKHTSLVNTWQEIDNLPLSSEEKISLFDLKSYLPQNLLYKMDIASMHSSIELRVPLLDHRLVEFAINLPSSLKIKNGEKKYLMKKFLEKYLPNEQIYRKKWGFPAPIEYWLQTDLSYLIDKYLHQEIIKKQDIFNCKFVKSLLNEFTKGQTYHYKRIWALIVFQMWYNKHIETIV